MAFRCNHGIDLNRHCTQCEKERRDFSCNRASTGSVLDYTEREMNKRWREFAIKLGKEVGLLFDFHDPLNNEHIIKQVLEWKKKPNDLESA